MISGGTYVACFGLMIEMYTGLPGHGKTTKIAQIAYDKLRFFESNQLYNHRIFSNIKFSEHIEQRFGVFGQIEGKNGAQFINYFEDIYSMPSWTDSEIFIDEAAVYFDSRLWESLPKEIRRFLFTHRHLGTNLHMIAQDFTTIDNSFRRLTENLYFVRKLLSSREPSPLLPPLKYPYNFCTINTVPRSHWHLEKDHYIFESTTMQLFTRKHFAIFDTRQSLPEQPLPPLRKEVRICPEDGYQKIRYI
jgi:hypothetical protein